eukprot:1186969-Amphidinium_carterae.1
MATLKCYSVDPTANYRNRLYQARPESFRFVKLVNERKCQNKKLIGIGMDFDVGRMLLVQRVLERRIASHRNYSGSFISELQTHMRPHFSSSFTGSADSFCPACHANCCQIAANAGAIHT